VAIPVLEDALERSIRLAAAMDSRGYGRTGDASASARRLTGACMLTGMAGLCLGAYGLLDGSALGPVALPAFALGAVLCGAGLFLGGRQVRRTQYRPDPWRWPEWVVVVVGLVPAVVLLAGAGLGAVTLHPSTDPLVWPSLPVVPAVAILIAAVAGVAAPPPLRSEPPTGSASPPTGTGETDARRSAARETVPAVDRSSVPGSSDPSATIRPLGVGVPE
jgi:energy-coupling factor transport system permease protein